MYSSNIGTSGHRASSSYSGYPYSHSQYKPAPVSHYSSQMTFRPPQQQYMPMGVNRYYSTSMAHPGVPQYMPAQAAPVIAVPAPAPVPAPVAAPAEASQPAVAGGINAVLEYEPNDMAAFLCWCAFGMLNQNRNPSKEFEKMAVSVLYATRLPKSSIIIALEYINQRFSTKPLGSLSEQEIFIKLVVALVLANKFNDDNTFTNRSWCGATGLQIEVINREEAVWLDEVKWQLNVVNFRDNIQTLEECWSTWVEKYSPQPQSASTFKNNAPGAVSPEKTYYNSSPINSSPLYSAPASTGYGYMPTSGMMSPSYYQDGALEPNYNFRTSYSSQSSIWAYTPNNYPYVPHHDQVMSGVNYFGYNNPYYASNMASC